MNEVPHNPLAIDSDDPDSGSRLLVLVYDELRKLAAARLAKEAPGITLQPTALVHEAYLRLASSEKKPHWDSRGHFFAAAAEAMRRILIENARRKRGPQRGGDRSRCVLSPELVAAPDRSEDLLALDEALEQLATIEPRAANVVKLRYFAGLTLEEVADALGISRRTADADWAYARAWLVEAVRGNG